MKKISVNTSTQIVVSEKSYHQEGPFEEVYLPTVNKGNEPCLLTYSAVIEPKSNFEEVFQHERKKMGDTFCLDPLHRWRGERSKINLSQITTPKRIYLVPHDMFGLNEEESHLRKYGLALCAYAPNYLLGLISSVPEKDMPLFTKNKRIIALGDQLFRGHFSNYAFLGVQRERNDRGFHQFEKDSIYQMELFWWMILAEEIETAVVPVN